MERLMSGTECYSAYEPPPPPPPPHPLNRECAVARDREVVVMSPRKEMLGKKNLKKEKEIKKPVKQLTDIQARDAGSNCK